jgi:hypothetical protein
VTSAVLLLRFIMADVTINQIIVFSLSSANGLSYGFRAPEPTSVRTSHDRRRAAGRAKRDTTCEYIRI